MIGDRSESYLIAARTMTQEKVAISRVELAKNPVSPLLDLANVVTKNSIYAEIISKIFLCLELTMSKLTFFTTILCKM